MLALKNKDGVLKPKPDVLKDLQKVIKMYVKDWSNYYWNSFIEILLFLW